MSSVSPASPCRRSAGMEKSGYSIGKNTGGYKKSMPGSPGTPKVNQKNLLLLFIPIKKPTISVLTLSMVDFNLECAAHSVECNVEHIQTFFNIREADDIVHVAAACLEHEASLHIVKADY